MNFYCNQPLIQVEKYKEYLSIVGSLSKLFSDSPSPYLYYRVAEKMFCKAFLANDLSRADVSYDACKDRIGIALKTFLRNNDNSLQKIAEFNKDIGSYSNKNIAEKIKILKANTSSILFEDGNYEYSFSLSKSTLMKRFLTKKFIDEFEIKILEEPLDELYSLINSKNLLLQKAKYLDTIYLPLYGSKGKVYNNSGLNQWNAKGRLRDKDEIYIPIPKRFYKYNPNFFPNKDIIFSLNLPNGKAIKAKICQDNNKALMSNPNKDLGKWLLRDVLKLKEGELVTNDLLNTYGIDSVRVDKISQEEYDINFSKQGSFEEFINKFE